MNQDLKCEFCKSEHPKELFSAGDPDKISAKSYNLMKCNNCGLVFTYPRPSRNELSGFYAQQYYGRLKVYPFNIIEKILIIFHQLRVRKIKKIARKGKILDIGCGKGIFLKCLLNNGFDIYGIEPSGVNHDDPSSKNLNIVNSDLNELHYPDSFFDIITLWHVFEHIPNPRELLIEIKRITKPTGVLVMAMPNMESLESKILRNNWFHLDMPRHLYHYTLKTLNNFLEEEGFEIFKIEYFSLEFGPFGLLQSLMNAMGAEFNFPAKILKGKKFTDFKGKRKYYSLFLSLFLMPFLPLIMFISILEAWLQKGAILQVYAKVKS